MSVLRILQISTEEWKDKKHKAVGRRQGVRGVQREQNLYSV